VYLTISQQKKGAMLLRAVQWRWSTEATGNHYICCKTEREGTRTTSHTVVDNDRKLSGPTHESKIAPHHLQILAAGVQFNLKRHTTRFTGTARPAPSVDEMEFVVSPSKRSDLVKSF